MPEQTLGEMLVELGQTFEQVARQRQRACPSWREASSELGDLDPKAQYGARIRELRREINARLAGLVGDRGRRGTWPAGDHLRRRLRFVGDAAEGAAANSWYPQTVASEYFVRYPAPPPGSPTHLPYLFIHLRAGGKGLCGRRACCDRWHHAPMEFMYGFSCFDTQDGSTKKLSPSAAMAMKSAVAHRAERLLAMRRHLEYHQQGALVEVNASQAYGETVGTLDQLDEADLRKWVDGDDPGMQSELSRAQLLSLSDEELLGRIAELYDYIRGFGEQVWELSRRTEEPSVFLSYRRADFAAHPSRRVTIGALARAIEARLGKGKVFWDDDLRDGDDYRLELTKRAEGAWLFVTLRGRQYHPWRDDPRGSDWCRNENDAARINGVPFLEVLVDGAPHIDERTRNVDGLPVVTTTLNWHPGGSGAYAEIDAIAGAVADAAARQMPPATDKA
jgi:hypothetical protein